MFSKLPAAFLLGLCLLVGTVRADDAVLKVAYISPDDHPFWLNFEKVLQAAAEDLNIELAVYRDTNKNRYSYLKQAE